MAWNHTGLWLKEKQFVCDNLTKIIISAIIIIVIIFVIFVIIVTILIIIIVIIILPTNLLQASLLSTHSQLVGPSFFNSGSIT